MKVDTSFTAQDVGRILAIHLIEEGYEVHEDTEINIPTDLVISVKGLRRAPGEVEHRVRLAGAREERMEASIPLPAQPPAPALAAETDGIANPEIIQQTPDGTRLLDVPRKANGLPRWSSRVGVVGDPVVAAPPDYPEQVRVRRTISVDSRGDTHLVAAGAPEARPAQEPEVPVFRSAKRDDPEMRRALAEADSPRIIRPSESVLSQLIQARRQRG